MSDYEEYEDYEGYEDEDYDIEEFKNEDKYESDIEIDDEKEQYIDVNELNDKAIEDDDNEDLEFINETIMLNSENIKTTKYLTLYEKTGVIGQRAEELSNQYEKDEFEPLVKINKDMINEYGELDFIKIAEKELLENKIPYYIKRLLPNNKYVIVDINDLILKNKY